MAANGARRAFQCSSSKTLFSGASSATRASSPFASKASSFAPGLSPKPSFASLSFRNVVRMPVELGAALSLMPMHSATSSALFTSLLSLHSQSWGCLSEGTVFLFRTFFH
ncbi:hypothetical protein LINPERPRIM_LOCUS28260 [Linum perenne]